MKRFNDYETTRSFSNTPKLPVGAYPIKIQKVRYEEGTNGNSDRIVLKFDIAEGEFKDFYKQNYEAQTGEDKKWKGVFTIYCPLDDGSEKDGWTKSRFKTIMEDIEASNGSYTWNWDENSLEGKIVGGLFGEINTVIDGKPITYVSMRQTVSIENLKKGNYKIPAAYNKGGASAPAPTTNSDGFMSIPAGAKEEIPF